MTDNAQEALSKRAQKIVVQASDDQALATASADRASKRVQAAIDIRDRFDSESPKVGLRDSTWLIAGIGTISAVAVTWGNSTGLDLFARMMVVGGGVTIIAAVASRRFLGK